MSIKCNIGTYNTCIITVCLFQTSAHDRTSLDDLSLGRLSNISQMDISQEPDNNIADLLCSQSQPSPGDREKQRSTLNTPTPHVWTQDHQQ